MSAYKKPYFTSITPIRTAESLGYFTLKWGVIGGTSGVQSYKIYRHIETIYPESQADGGPYRDPAYNGIDRDDNPPVYHQIATVTGSTTYTDTLTDLSMHSPQGIVKVGGRWVDGDGNDILTDIFETRRRLYYKIEAVIDVSAIGGAFFRSLPFIFLAHDNGSVECRSTIKQCVWNRLYDEGGVVWKRDDLAETDFHSLAFDSIFEAEDNRLFNLWVGGSTNKVYCIDGRNGNTVKEFTIPTTNIRALGIDPDTGDCFAMGDSTTLYRCDLDDDSVPVKSIGTQSKAYSPYGNVGLVVTKESGTTKVYSIANHKFVIKWDIGSATSSVIPRTVYGDNSNVSESTRNVFGITIGPDSNVWVNGHDPYLFQWTYQATEYYQVQTSPRTCGWKVPSCIYFDSPRNGYDAYCGGSWRRVKSDPDHWGCTGPTYTTYSRLIDEDWDVYGLKDKGYVYGVSPSNYGDSSDQFTDCTGRKYDCPLAPTPEDLVNRSNVGAEPTLAQRGLCGDLSHDGGSTYNLWQSITPEDKTISIDVTTNNAGATGVSVENTDDVYHTSVDSDNSVWAIQNDSSNNIELTKIYQLQNTSNFPSGGLCTWPESTPPILSGGQYVFVTPSNSYDYDSMFNNTFIEWVLTRDVIPVATTVGGLDPTSYLSGGIVIDASTLAEQISVAQTHCLATSSTTDAGTRVFPYYTGVLSQKTFEFSPGNLGQQTLYNTDNTGILSLFNSYGDGGTLVSEEDFTRPAEEYPDINLKILYDRSTPRLSDGTFWDDQGNNNTSQTQTSGYDDMTATLSAITDYGSFGEPTWVFSYDDKPNDIGGDVNPTDSGSLSYNKTKYKYHDPSQSGKPGNRYTGWPGETDGVFSPTVTATYHRNPYLLEGINPDSMGTSVDSTGYPSLTGDVYSASNIVSAFVWERWPTAEFYVTPFNNEDCIPSAWGAWNPPEPAVGDNGLVERDEDRVVWGYDPLSAQFTDYSVSRTWPLCAWYWDFGDETEFLGFTLPPLSPECGGPFTTSSVLVCTDPDFHPRDSVFTTHPNMVRHTYRGSGTYYATLYVLASNTGTDSWNISAGITDEDIMQSTFTVAASRRIDVYEVCPVGTFSLVSGATVPSDYIDQPHEFFDVGISGVQAYQTIDGEFISGYAPNLTVKWEGVATPRSLPISAVVWDFGDGYSDGSIYNDSFGSPRENFPTQTDLYPAPTAGWPTWDLPGTFDNSPSAVHTFVMPGYYTVSFNTLASSDQVTNACELCSKPLHVYVKELMPTPCFTTSYSATSGFSTDIKGGTSPFTIYFNPSCAVPGSFPICRIVWDFGDGTTQTVSRLMSSDYVFTPSLTAYPNDLADPRNIIVSHEYNRTLTSEASALTATMYAYACNTNSVMSSSVLISPVDLADRESSAGNVHLIMNRMYDSDNDVVYTFENESDRATYNVLLSSGRI